MNSPVCPFSTLGRNSLNVPKEGTYFILVLIFSILVWLGLLISVIGIFYAALFGFLAWIASGLLAAHLRAEAVLVDERQLPQLHATFLGVCQKLGITTPPRLYLLQSGGALNAFATRFAGRDFVVIYSDLLEAFGPTSPEIQFILGHELGHIRSSHILKRVFLAPGIMLPLLGPAYLRACETSSDRHGAFVADNLDGALRAMLTLGGGKHKERELDPVAFAEQHWDERGFFVSWHELTSPYPTLSQRTAQLLALREPGYGRQAPRNPFAYLCALFTPGGQLGSGAANMMVVVVVIGLLAAMAIPAFAKVRGNSLRLTCANNERLISSAYAQREIEIGRPPANLSQVIGPGKPLELMPKCPAGGRYSITPLSEGGCEVTCSIHGDATLPAPARSRPGD